MLVALDSNISGKKIRTLKTLRTSVSGTLVWSKLNALQPSWQGLFHSGLIGYMLSTILGNLVFILLELNIIFCILRLFNVLFNMVKPFLNDRVKDNTVFHGSGKRILT